MFPLIRPFRAYGLGVESPARVSGPAGGANPARQRIANLALAGWLAADAIRVFLFARDFAADFADVAGGVGFLMAAIFVLRRGRPLAGDATPAPVVVALTATVLPVFFAWLAPQQGTTASAVAAQGAAVLLMVAGLFYLGRNFSVLPQHRGTITSGPYALVRHPIYSSYLIFDGALALEAQSWLAIALWLAEWGLLSLRARFEERLLAASDPAYGRYLARVRWRFVPGVA
jgi:protein-S-isoprenylcysteine O-methyltransferase Ste14